VSNRRENRITGNAIAKLYQHGRCNVLHLIGWIIFGAVVGLIANLLHPGRDPGGFMVTILIGIAGSLLGGFVGRMLGLYRQGEGAGFIVSVLGAIILLVIYRFVALRRAA
jgi:uncharacterized membrane protein YeaQ/YmgE (transglycosylase-associated protein family)